MRLVPQTAAATWRVLYASVACYFPLVFTTTVILFLCLYVSSGVLFSLAINSYFQVSATSPAGRHDSFHFICFLVSFDSFSFFVSLLFPFVFSPQPF